MCVHIQQYNPKRWSHCVSTLVVHRLSRSTPWHSLLHLHPALQYQDWNFYWVFWVLDNSLWLEVWQGQIKCLQVNSVRQGSLLKGPLSLLCTEWNCPSLGSSCTGHVLEYYWDWPPDVNFKKIFAIIKYALFKDFFMSHSCHYWNCYADLMLKPRRSRQILRNQRFFGYSLGAFKGHYSLLTLNCKFPFYVVVLRATYYLQKLWMKLFAVFNEWLYWTRTAWSLSFCRPSV